MGLVHISEIDRNYVKDVRDHLREGDTVEVKVTSIKDDGKIDLSIKALQDPAPPRPVARAAATPSSSRSSRSSCARARSARSTTGAQPSTSASSRGPTCRPSSAPPISNVVRDQLGREPTTTFEVTARCAERASARHPQPPLDAAGEPFPTTFWLTCPDAVKAVSRLESGGAIARLNDRFGEDAAFRAAVERAHADAAEDRARDAPGGASVGGRRRHAPRVKCLHAHYANHLAGGDDVVGAWVAERGRAHPPRCSARPADRRRRSGNALVPAARRRAGEPTASRSSSPSDMIITRLGQGVDATGLLDPEALARTETVFARYCRRARALGRRRIRVAATSAVRDAAEPRPVRRTVRRHARHRPRGDRRASEEARLSFLGGTRGLAGRRRPVPPARHRRGVDGVRGRDGAGRAEHADRQHPDRSVRLTERLVPHRSPSPEELDALRTTVAERSTRPRLAVPAIHDRAHVRRASRAPRRPCRRSRSASIDTTPSRSTGRWLRSPTPRRCSSDLARDDERGAGGAAGDGAGTRRRHRRRRGDPGGDDAPVRLRSTLWCRRPTSCDGLA